MKLPQAVLAKLSESTTPAHSNLNFWGYYSSMWSWWHCKESAGITIPTINEKQYLIVSTSENIISEFKRLAKMFGVEAEVSTFTAKVRGKDYTLYHITGWFDQNVLTREMGRFLLRQAETTIYNSCAPIKSIKKFVKSHYLAAYTNSSTSEIERFLINLKKNVEAADVTKLGHDQIVDSGFIRWIQNGFLTF